MKQILPTKPDEIVEVAKLVLETLKTEGRRFNDRRQKYRRHCFKFWSDKCSIEDTKLLCSKLTELGYDGWVPYSEVSYSTSKPTWWSIGIKKYSPL